MDAMIQVAEPTGENISTTGLMLPTKFQLSMSCRRCSAVTSSIAFLFLYVSLLRRNSALHRRGCRPVSATILRGGRATEPLCGFSYGNGCSNIALGCLAGNAPAGEGGTAPLAGVGGPTTGGG